MRGTSTPETRLVFTLRDGFKALPQFKPKPVEKPCGFQAPAGYRRTLLNGLVRLDKMLGGGYLGGSTVLIEIDENISTLRYHLIAAPTVRNFGAMGGAL